MHLGDKERRKREKIPLCPSPGLPLGPPIEVHQERIPDAVLYVDEIDSGSRKKTSKTSQKQSGVYSVDKNGRILQPDSARRAARGRQRPGQRGVKYMDLENPKAFGEEDNDSEDSSLCQIPLISFLCRFVRYISKFCRSYYPNRRYTTIIEFSKTSSASDEEGVRPSASRACSCKGLLASTGCGEGRTSKHSGNGDRVIKHKDPVGKVTWIKGRQGRYMAPGSLVRPQRLVVTSTAPITSFKHLSPIYSNGEVHHWVIGHVFEFAPDGVDDPEDLSFKVYKD